MGLGARVVTYLHRLGLIDAVGEHSLGLRLLRIADLIKNRSQAENILKLFPTIWRLLIGKDHHTLHLNHPVKMRILPTNLASLVRLWGKLPCKVVEPAYNTIIWEVLPGRLIKSRTDAGMDLAILVEIFVQKQYGTNYKGLRVLDIGGYHGESAIFFVLMGAQRVVCVEPYPPALSRIRENLRLSGTEEHVKVIATAVGAERGEGVLFVSEADSQSNTLQGVGRSGTPADFSSSIRVPVLTFEDILNEAGWEEVDVAKLDCEGCEYAIFSSASDESLRRVKVWIMEFHDGAERIVRRLRALKYQIEYEERPDKMGMLKAWLPGAILPWLPPQD